ncbi:MAG TPA: hypothetical protein VG798_02480 [Rhizomicrobium sp.]|nr:hypothetical protein [Rhizomicrobium sp.]
MLSIKDHRVITLLAGETLRKSWFQRANPAAMIFAGDGSRMIARAAPERRELEKGMPDGGELLHRHPGLFPSAKQARNPV